MQIGDKHVSRLVRDQERRLRLHCHCLRRHATRPEHRHFSEPDVDGVAEIGPGEVADAFEVDSARALADVAAFAADLERTGCATAGAEAAR